MQQVVKLKNRDRRIREGDLLVGCFESNIDQQRDAYLQ